MKSGAGLGCTRFLLACVHRARRNIYLTPLQYHRQMKSVYFACLLGSFPPGALAARPFVTDDARLTTAGSCQLESWTRIYPYSHEEWFLPACNPGGNLEFTAGGGVARASHEKSTSDYVLQVKTLFRPLSANDWGWGVAIGTIRHPDSLPGPNLFGNKFVNLPASISFNDDKTIVHVNLGWLVDNASGKGNMTWGTGGEFQLTPRLLAIAETYGDDHSQPFWQVGGRYSVVPNLVQVDTTVGQQFSGASSGRWISVGLRITPDRMF
jgi:hypothetical protein